MNPFPPNSVDPNRNTHPSAPAEPQADLVQVAKRRPSTSGETRGAVCPITQEPVGLFPRDDIYMTLSGVQYHKPSLKRWLQKSDAMPHNNVNSPEEILRFWPRTDGSIATLTARQDQWARSEFHTAVLMIWSGTAAAMSLGAFAILLASPDEGARGEPFFSKDTYCAIALGVSVCLAGVSFGVHRDRNRLFASIETLRSTRPMTDIENKKADLGIDYYQKISL